jgi:hypothetical protein
MNALTEALLKQVKSFVVESAVVYGPAIKRLAGDQATALGALLNQEKHDEAMQLVRAEMTLEELSKEKVNLAEWTRVCAESSHEVQQLLRDIGLGVVKALLTMALTMVAL